MRNLDRREFLAIPAQAAVSAAVLQAAAAAKPRIGLVHSTHGKLAVPASAEDPLTYEKVRDMVWKAIEYGRPKAGSLEAKIKPGSWVVVKPNIVALRPRPSYRTGDITDMRVTEAVVEYVAARSRAARVTIAEGGSYRRTTDPNEDNVNRQNGVRVDAASFDWGTDEFPGWSGTLGGILERMAARFPNKKFDYVDLSYDALRDASGNFQRVEVPKTARGVGGFGARTDYVITSTIRDCDFLISVPVMKIHNMCGITACFKNYVGTAPRIFYAPKGSFSNGILHNEHSLEGRIDSFIVDLASFHPPDYNVIDAIRGLQYTEHNNNRPDQMIRSNMILAGEDTVAMDTMASHLLGFNTWDMEFLHMASARDLGVMDLSKVDLAGDDPERFRRYWARPRDWFGRCNREWLVTKDPSSDVRGWSRYSIPTDTLHFDAWAGGKAAPDQTFGAAVRVNAAGSRKAFLWLGLQGRVTAYLNGEKVTEEESMTRYRIGQFRKAVELRSGENLLVFHFKALSEKPQMSALLSGPRNDGDTVDGIRYSA